MDDSSPLNNSDGAMLDGDGKILAMRVDIPFLPPSSNHIYVTDWRKKIRFLTKEAKAFQRRFSAEVVPHYLNIISSVPPDNGNNIWNVHYSFYFDKDDILNKTFGEKGGAKSRYKKMDVENRVKLIADCFFKAIGLDDSLVFDEGSSKQVCPPNLQPHVRIFLHRMCLDAGGVSAWEQAVEHT